LTPGQASSQPSLGTDYRIANLRLADRLGSENLTYNYPTGANNGKLSSMYNAVSGETITYQYDSLNRLFKANGSGWGEQYAFDGFGNLTTKALTSGSGPSLSVTVNPANNQIQGVSGLSYDANGNQNAGSYDAENRLTGAGGIQYAYDSQNKRLWSWTGGTDPYGQGNPNGYFVNLYTPGGQKLAAYEINIYNIATSGLDLITVSTLSSSDQYFGGRRLAVLDQLGSVGTYFPWGEDKGSTNPQNTWGFATYWEDSATGLDYANNRYYSNQYARFISPDPAGQAAANPRDPVSWNRYAYAENDPVNRNDPHGLLVCDVDDPSCDPFSPDPDDDNDDDGGEGINYPCYAPDGFTPNPNPYCQVGGPPVPQQPKQPEFDCQISLFYRPVPGTPANHAFIEIAGSLGTWIIEGEPQYQVIGILTGDYGSLITYETKGPNGYNGTDNPKTHNVTEQGKPYNDPNCLLSDVLLGLGTNSEFNEASGAPPGGWPYFPTPYCIIGRLCTANSNSFASFLLSEVGLNFGKPPDVPGWGILNQ
jgi:RHS repeat-associated protein